MSLMTSSRRLAQLLSKKLFLRKYVWYKIGILTSEKLLALNPGFSHLTQLDNICRYIRHGQRTKIRVITEKLREVGFYPSSFTWLCDIVFKECQSDRELCTFAMVFLIAMIDMLEQTELEHLNDTTEVFTTILSEALQENLQSRDSWRTWKCFSTTLSLLPVIIFVIMQIGD